MLENSDNKQFIEDLFEEISNFCINEHGIYLTDHDEDKLKDEIEYICSKFTITPNDKHYTRNNS